MDIMVSVLCATYNQEKYIGKALESFVAQKTDFPFEVIVHDDASTDHTAEIIRKYAKRYPDIIKPIFEKDNQHSKGVPIAVSISIPKAKGKYFALCEGDDYWISPNKLQTQVDYMEAHPGCTLCIHNAEMVRENGEFRKHWIISRKECDFTTDQVILGGGGFCPTNSILGPMRLVRNPPQYLVSFSLDFTWQIYLASQGYTHCFPQRMSAYRLNSIGSWSRRASARSKEEQVSFSARVGNMLEGFDASTGRKYHESVRIYRNKNYLDLMIGFEDADFYKKQEGASSIKFLPFSKRLKVRMFLRFPNLYKKTRKLWHYIKKMDSVKAHGR